MTNQYPDPPEKTPVPQEVPSKKPPVDIPPQKDIPDTPPPEELPPDVDPPPPLVEPNEPRQAPLVS